MKLKEKIKELIVPKKRNSNNRILYLEFLKVLAAYLVVFYHLSFMKLNYNYYGQNNYLPNLNRIIESFAACSVPLFFLIHGILMFRRKRTWSEVYAKAFRIFIITVIWSLGGFPNWFFKTLIILYLLFPVFQYLRINYKKGYQAICIFIFIMPFLYNFFLFIFKCLEIKEICGILVENWNVTGLSTMYSILYFLLGPELESQKKHSIVKGLGLSLIGWALVVVECVVYTNINGTMYDGVNAAFPTIGALCLTIGIYKIASRFSFEKSRMIWEFLGRAVLPVYLIHMMLFIPLHVHIDWSNVGMLGLLAGTAGIYLLCAVLGEIGRRIPIICFLLEL